MASRRWCIGCISEENEYDNFYRALQGGKLNRLILRANEEYVVPAAQDLLSLDEDVYRIVAQYCEKKIAARMKEKGDTFIRMPNDDVIRTTITWQQEKVSAGLFALLKKKVPKQVTIPNPDFERVLVFLKGEDTVLINSFRSEDEYGGGHSTEHDDAYLLTSGGRIVNLQYSVSYTGNGVEREISGCREVPYNDVKANILLAALIVKHMGYEAFQRLLMLGPDN